MFFSGLCLFSFHLSYLKSNNYFIQTFISFQFISISISIFFFFFLLFIFNFQFIGSFGANGMHLTRITIPKVVDFRENAYLSCEYAMDNDTLHSVKWYKDTSEFFRWVNTKKKVKVISSQLFYKVHTPHDTILFHFFLFYFLLAPPIPSHVNTCEKKKKKENLY